MKNRDQLILKAIHQHSSAPDWYAAQLVNAIVHTSSIEEAITLADIMFEDNPEPPETSDEHERAALEDLAGQLERLGGQESVNAAMASVDQRGVEHQGKGSPKGGQFVAHGQGEADIEKDTPEEADPNDVELVDEEPDVIDLEDTGLGDVNPFDDDAENAPPEEEEVYDLAGEEVDESLVTPEYHPQEEQTFKELVSFYSPEKQAIAKSLRYAPATSIDNIAAGMQSEGIDPTKRIALEDGNRGIFKSQRGEAGFIDGRFPPRDSIPAGTYYRREIMASIAADIWGFGDLVPVTVERKVGRDTGSMQHFVENSVTGWEYGINNEDDMYGSDEDLARAAIFDYVFGATDRKPDNWMMKELKSELDPNRPFPDFDSEILPERSTPPMPDNEEQLDPNRPFPDFTTEELGITPRSVGKKTLIDNSLALPIHAGSEGFYHNFLLARAVSDDLPMPDLSAMRETWPQTEAAMRAGGIEEQAISLLKKRFNEATSGRAKTIGELKSPYSDSPGTIHDHLGLRGKLSPPRQGRLAKTIHSEPEAKEQKPLANWLQERKKQRDAENQQDIEWPEGEPVVEEKGGGGIWNWLINKFKR